MASTGPINLDANATYGLLPEVVDALKSFNFSLFNPSSVHQGGQRARALVEQAREELRLLLDLPEDARIIFTSGATEANATAIMLPFWRELALSGLALGRIVVRPEVITTAFEHPSVVEGLRRIEKLGARIVSVGVDANGNFVPERFRQAAGVGTKLASVMLANNETGHLFPVSEIACALRERAPAAYIHTDAVQAIGKLPVKFSDLAVDMLSVSGHKFGSLAGVGALIVNERVDHEPLLLGGPQETRWRAGTENVIGIVSMGLAARAIRTSLPERIERMRRNRDHVWQLLSGAIGDLRLNSDLVHGLPNTLSITIDGVRADDLLVAIDLSGVCVSSGSACASGKPEPSPVLSALGLREDAARETIRISVKAEYAEGELDFAAEAIVSAIRTMRERKRAA